MRTEASGDFGEIAVAGQDVQREIPRAGCEAGGKEISLASAVVDVVVLSIADQLAPEPGPPSGHIAKDAVETFGIGTARGVFKGDDRGGEVGQGIVLGAGFAQG